MPIMRKMDLINVHFWTYLIERGLLSKTRSEVPTLMYTEAVNIVFICCRYHTAKLPTLAGTKGQVTN